MKQIIIWHDGSEEILSREEFEARYRAGSIPAGALVRDENSENFVPPADFFPSTPREVKKSDSGVFWACFVVVGVLGFLASAVANGILLDNSSITALIGTVGLMGAVGLGIWLYVLPITIARNRKHHQVMAITAVCILFGWTFLGWGIALVWALTAVRKDLRA